MNSPKPYGYAIVYERTKPGGGLMPEHEEATLRRAGTETSVKRAAALQRGFTRIVSCTPIPASEAPAPRKKRGLVAAIEPPVTTMTDADVESAATAIHAIRKAAEGLAAIARDRRALVEAITTNASTIERLCPSADGKIGHIIARCDRLRELFNMEELESWQITVNNVMTETWQQLPH